MQEPFGGPTGSFSCQVQDAPAAEALFFRPCGLAVAADGAIFVANRGNHRIRRIADGAVTTFAGSGAAGGDDGVGATASFEEPQGLANSADGVLYVTEVGGHCVRMISPPAGVVTTLAGAGRWGFADGADAVARCCRPCGIAVNAAGTVFVADQGNHRIRHIMKGVGDTPAGSGKEGFDDGAGAAGRRACQLTPRRAISL